MLSGRPLGSKGNGACMPLPASHLEKDSFLRLEVEGPAKLGKTRSIGDSLSKAFGFGYIIQCGTRSSMGPLQRVCKKFEWDLIRDENQMETSIKAARTGAKEERYAWVLLDDFNFYTTILLEDLAYQSRNQKGEPDGRRYWPEWYKRTLNTITRLMDIPVHFVMTCHPDSFMGKMKDEIPGQFTDVIVFAHNNKHERVFLLNSETAPGRACRSYDDALEMEADCGKLWKLFQSVTATAPGVKTVKK